MIPEIAKTIAMGDMVWSIQNKIDLNKKDDLGTGYIDIFRWYRWPDCRTLGCCRNSNRKIKKQ